MNKVVLGIVVGGILGLIDGGTAWFTPEVRNQMVPILIGSTVKGILCGVLAGWFARKVSSVPAGIAFGLGVGLVLSFLIAAMGKPHYWFEIMLPGSAVGAIVGWATQRYGRRTASASPAAVAMIFCLVALNAHAAHTGQRIEAADAFAKLKALAGEWNGNIMTPDGPVARVQYRVTAGGHAVMETLFAGTPHEMITMYTLDGENLVATHYCSGNNQPTMKLNTEHSSASEYVFDFVKVTGATAAGDHIHGAKIKFVGDRLESEWQSSKSETKKFYLARLK